MAWSWSIGISAAAVVTLTGCGDNGVMAPPPNPNCTGSATPLALALGDVHPLTSQELCQVQLDAGAGAEYVLVTYFATLTSSANLELDVRGTNVAPASGPPHPQRIPERSAAQALVSPFAVRGAGGAPLRDEGFDLRLRRRERQLLSEHAAAARAWYRQRRGAGDLTAARGVASAPRLTLMTAGAQVGDRVSVNVQEDNACGSPVLTNARVAAITNHAVVLADTANPAGGFTDAEFQSFGAQFDTLVNPLDTQAFGAPADIDNNGRVVILFTKAVNALTPANSDFFVGGFFFGRDLLDTTTCPSSNFAEMFYLLAPDPAGTINGNTRTKGFVDSITVSTLAHEYQHLINASRRLYVNTGADPVEEVWLNEGLSHVAEELLFYRASGLQPRQNIDFSTLVSVPRITNAFNLYQLQNVARLSSYLENPDSTAPYRSDQNDDLSTRGATWEFLRYAADRKATTDGTIWFDLVNSQTSGISNVQNVFGITITDWVNDFATAQYADDAGLGVPARYTYPSWNFRDIFAGFQCCSQLPLHVRAVLNGTPASVTLSGGGTAYFRFAEGGASPTTVSLQSQGQPVPSTLKATIIRTK